MNDTRRLATFARQTRTPTHRMSIESRLISCRSLLQPNQGTRKLGGVACSGIHSGRRPQSALPLHLSEADLLGRIKP